MNQINVIFFASLKDKVGVKHIILNLPDPLRVTDLRNRLADVYPQAREALLRCLVAVNKNFAFDDDFVPTEAEVAFFPPVSGG